MGAFFWLLWGDFCFTLMETAGPSLMPLLLREYGASNREIAIMVTSITSVLNCVITPIVNVKSDRHRGSRGRRIPFLLWPTPFIALFLGAMAIAVSGAWMMGAGRGGGAPVLNAPLGNLFSVTTALWYALYFLVISQARQTEAATRLMAWSSAAGAPLLLISAMILGEQILPANLAGLAACVGLGVVHTAGQGSIAWAMGRLPTSLASVVVLVQPVVATYAGWVLFGEALGPLQTVGALVALAGVVLAQWASRPRAPLKP